MPQPFTGCGIFALRSIRGALFLPQRCFSCIVFPIGQTLWEESGAMNMLEEALERIRAAEQQAAQRLEEARRESEELLRAQQEQTLRDRAAQEDEARQERQRRLWEQEQQLAGEALRAQEKTALLCKQLEAHAAARMDAAVQYLLERAAAQWRS